MTTYCYKIKSKLKKQEEEGLKETVESFYRNKDISESYFKDDESIPFIIIYLPTENRICIKMTKSGKAVLARIEDIHFRLRTLLKQSNLSPPEIFEAEQCKWWETDCETKKSEKAWETLSHKGPYFSHLMDPYKPLKASIIYNGKSYPLNASEEEVAGFYAKRLISEKKGNIIELSTKDAVFNKNYWNDFKTYLTKEHREIFKDFSKLDFSDLVKKIEKVQEDNKLNKDKIEARKIKEAEKKMTYGWVYVDGIRQAVGNFNIEPASIFYGRGKNPLRGKIKKAIYPEDVTINVGASAAEKVVAPHGHSWGDIVHDQDSTWLAKWKDTITDQIKYVFLSAEGKFKGQSDFAKYEKARKLNDQIEIIREKYMKDAKSSDSKKRQLGTVLYLIDIHGLRVGNEKGEDEADTVGASTLTVDNVKINLKSKTKNITFDFLGKDSIQFYKELEVPEVIYKNFKDFLKQNKENSLIFNSISSIDINEYLKQFDTEFSAKVFRTRLASETMKNALEQVGSVPSGSTKADASKLFKKANAKVAEMLNHKRTVSKKSEERIKKLKQELKKLKQERDEKKKEGKNTDAIKKRINAKKANIETSKDTLSVAITTSLTNYIDPRLVVNWIKSNNLEIGTVYTPTLQKKFKWALEMEEYIQPEDKKVAKKSSKILHKKSEKSSPKSPKKSSPKSPKKSSPKFPKKSSPKSPKKSGDKIKNISISDYSEKSIVIRGDTKVYKDILQSLGGIWNPNLKDGAGWIFSVKKKEELQKLIKDQSKEQSKFIAFGKEWTSVDKFVKKMKNKIVFNNDKSKSKSNSKKNITISDYSDKAVIVRGDTKAYKDTLQTLGGIWNPNLKDGAGWVFSIKKKEDLEKWLKSDPESYSDSDLRLIANYSLYSQNPDLINPKDTPELERVDKCIKAFSKESIVF